MRLRITYFIAMLFLQWGLETSVAHGANKAPGSPKWFCDSLEDQDPKSPQAAAARQQCLDVLMAGVAEKRIHYRKENAKACLKANNAYRKDTSKANLAQARTTCASVVEGMKAKGAACDSVLECKLGLTCVGITGGPPGVCAPQLKEGASCDDSSLNGTVLFSLVGATRAVCVRGTSCRAVKNALLCVRD